MDETSCNGYNWQTVESSALLNQPTKTIFYSATSRAATDYPWPYSSREFRRGLCQTTGKREKEDFDTLSEWVSVRSLIYIKINQPNGSMSTCNTSIFKDPNVYTKHLSHLHDNYVVVPAEKASSNIVFVYKSHYIDCLIKELCIDNPSIPQWHLRKWKSWTIMGLFCVSLECQPKMKNWIYHHSIGFLNYTTVLINSTILLGKNSFRFTAPTLWNSLPDNFRTENSFSPFKSLLQSWDGSKCRCSACRWLKFCFWFAYILKKI